MLDLKKMLKNFIYFFRVCDDASKLTIHKYIIEHSSMSF